MDIIGTIATVLGSNLVVAVLVWLRFRKKDSAETDKIDAEAAKLLAEAKKINIDSDNQISIGWQQVSLALQKERDKCHERIEELETMLEKEEEMSAIKLHKQEQEHDSELRKLKEAAIAMEKELRKALQEERERYDLRINQILQQILEFKK